VGHEVMRDERSGETSETGFRGQTTEDRRHGLRSQNPGARLQLTAGSSQLKS
jgi:hypothetical protein